MIDRRVFYLSEKIMFKWYCMNFKDSFFILKIFIEYSTPYNEKDKNNFFSKKQYH